MKENMEYLESVRILWDYMHLNEEVKKCDCILGLGTNDLEIPKRCAELYHDGYADMIIFTGANAKSTLTWNKTEAETFRDIAISLGVPKNKIYIETKATNTGDNFIFTKELILKNNLNVNTFLIVQKPYMERRCYAAFKKIMPGKECVVTSPQISLEKYMEMTMNKSGSVKPFINTLVGDVERMKVYADRGWQIKQDIPNEVWEAYLELVKLGFDEYVLEKEMV